MAKTKKRFDPENQKRRAPMIAGIVALLAAAGFMQSKIDPTAKKMQGDQTNTAKAFGGLNNEFLLLPLLGFREAAAGLLWVRCDEFFHSGDYDAILPMVRLITYLDPHADNVYVTGAWHLSYNFTDSSERSDRRYIGPALAFLREGVANNPNIPDIKFELGWENYDKVKDFPEAEKAFKDAIAGPKGDGMAYDFPQAANREATDRSDDYPYAAPIRMIHILAHTYEKQGRLPEAIAIWNQALVRSAKDLADAKKNAPTDVFKLTSLHAAEQHNHDEDFQRWHDRYTFTNHDTSVNPANHPGVLGIAAGEAPKVWDLAFKPEIVVSRAKVFKVRGQVNMADGGRIDVKLTDWDYVEKPADQVQEKFSVDPSQTILMDSISIRKNHFEREMNMSQDPKMYNFSQPYYRIALTFNPRTTSPHIQDRFGYSGEGMTDSDLSHITLDAAKTREPLGTKFIEGQGGTGPVWDGVQAPWGQFGQPMRMLRVVFKVSRAQLMGSGGPITEKDIVPGE